MIRIIAALALLLATTPSVASEGDGCVEIDLARPTASEVVMKSDIDWPTAMAGFYTKPFIPWTVNDGEGTTCIDFGDLHPLALATGKRTFISVDVNGADNLMVVGLDEAYLVDQIPRRGMVEFSLFEAEATNFILAGLARGSTVDFKIYILKSGEYQSAAPHGLTYCAGSSTIEQTCDGTDLVLGLVEWRRYQPFGVESVLPPETADDPTPEELFRQFLPKATDDVPKVVNPPGMGLK